MLGRGCRPTSSLWSQRDSSPHPSARRTVKARPLTRDRKAERSGPSPHGAVVAEKEQEIGRHLYRHELTLSPTPILTLTLTPRAMVDEKGVDKPNYFTATRTRRSVTSSRNLPVW
jgi:hypothetical protein